METAAIVPKGPTSTTDEVDALVKQLAGHGAFARCRGQLDTDAIMLLEDVIRESDGRDSAMRSLRRLTSDLLIIGSKLAQLEFSGQKQAHWQFRSALTNRRFLLTGESVPLDRTIPMTILMLEPSKTLLLLKWMTEATTIELNRHLGIVPVRSSHKTAEVQPITRKLFESFPTLEGLVRSANAEKHDNGTEILPLFREIVNGLPTTFDGALPLSNTEDTMYRLLYGTEHGGCGGTFVFPIAWLFPGKDQAEVLSLFDRKDQERVATWQTNVPDICLSWGSLRGAKVGFHPENEHSRWSEKMPPFISKGLASEHGTFIDVESLDFDTRYDYRNKMWVKKSEDPESNATKLVLKPGKLPRMELEVNQATEEQISSARAVIDTYRKRIAAAD